MSKRGLLVVIVLINIIIVAIQLSMIIGLSNINQKVIDNNNKLRKVQNDIDNYLLSDDAQEAYNDGYVDGLMSERENSKFK